ncbi:MAG: division/cell wall cluster transcriptional repressor MraZ [Cyclobacteriaceae bacterium]|nr:division/cell wall cluster transcriptional repressor MraZ [Cyclobacteriaceae bacterium]
MSFFTSEYTCKLDAKGRLVLPARFKSALPESSGNQLVVGHGFDPCLVIYPMVEFKKKESQISGLNEFDAENRKLQRAFFNSHTEVELDNSGRFLIPKKALAYAKLEKEAILIGVGKKIEVWSPAFYNGFMTQNAEEYSQLVQKKLSGE